MNTAPPQRPGLSGRWASFRYAGRGLCTLVATQWNARIHAVATVAVVVAGFFLGLTRMEWCAVVLAIGLVWVAEAMNTAIEFLADRVSVEFHDLTKKAKDVAAGGVLAASIVAVVIALLIFLPKVIPSQAEGPGSNSEPLPATQTSDRSR
ncbi:MAG: diacylglycerol kinase family protein [Chthoniobacteraceae bacterium]